MQETLYVFRELRFRAEFPIRDEFPLVPPSVVHRHWDRLLLIGCGIANRDGTAREIVHDPLPFAAKIAGRERHVGIDAGRIQHKVSEPSPMGDVTRLHRGVFIRRIRNGFDALRGGNVSVREYPLQTAIRHELPALRLQNGFQHEVANLPGPAVLPVLLVPNGELVEPPVIRHGCIAFGQIPDRVQIRHDLNLGRNINDVLPQSATVHLIRHTPSQVVWHHLRRWHGAWNEGRQIVGFGVGERHQPIGRAEPVMTRNPELFVQEPVSGDRVRQIPKVLNDMRELLFRPIRRHDLVKAEQVSCVTNLLQFGHVPREPEPNLGFVRVTGLPDTTTRRYVLPRNPQIRPHAVEFVESEGNTRLSRPSTSLEISNQ